MNITQASGGQTTAPIAPTVNGALHPEFYRLPKSKQVDPFFGLSRSKTNELILPTKENNQTPPVKSICMRKRGARRGIRLVSYDSMRQYLHSLASEAA